MPSVRHVVAAAFAFVVAAGSIARAIPANDTCQNATVVPDNQANRYFDSVDLATATATDEPTPSCTGDPLERTVWYQWTAPEDGQLLVLNGCNEPTYTVVASTWPETCAATDANLDCDAATCPAQTLTTFVTKGTTYRVQLGVAPLTTVTGPLIVELCFLGPEQDDADDDGLPDCIDGCTDSDRDNFGDTPLSERPFETCPGDNCPDDYNADQADKDGDGVGDACDTDEEKDDKTLQEAADDGDVELSSKGCFFGDCIKITIRNTGTRGLRVRIRPGDVLLSRDEGEQDLGITRAQNIYVPPGGMVMLGGLYTVCLELDRHGPSSERIFDVTDSLADLTDRPNLRAVNALLGSSGPRGDTTTSPLQAAIWAVTNGGGILDATAVLLTRVGLDPSALPPGGFPDAVNPNAGNPDPVARHVAGLLRNTPDDCTANSDAATTATCLATRIIDTVTAATTIKKKLRGALGKRARSVRAAIDSAIRVGPTTPKGQNRLSLARRRTEALGRLVTRAAGKGQLPDPTGSTLIALVGQLTQNL